MDGACGISVQVGDDRDESGDKGCNYDRQHHVLGDTRSLGVRIQSIARDRRNDAGRYMRNGLLPFSSGPRGTGAIANPH